MSANYDNRQAAINFALEQTQRAFAKRSVEKAAADILYERTSLTRESCAAAATFLRPLLNENSERALTADMVEPMMVVKYGGQVRIMLYSDLEGDLYTLTGSSIQHWIEAGSVHRCTRPTDDEIKEVVGAWFDRFKVERKPC